MASHGTTELDAPVRRLTEQRVPGLTVIVVQTDRVLTEDALALADLAAKLPTTLDAVYLWFSMTKIVTATAVLRLAERQRLRLDDPVANYLPEFPTPRSGWLTVQIKHFLNHSSGMVNPIPVRWVHPADQPGRDPHQFTLELLDRYPKLRFPAGSKASYSNLGYIALGEVITTAAVRRYEDHVRENILRPLGMTHTDFAYRPDIKGDAATGYRSRVNPLTPLFRRMLPSGIVGRNQGRFLAFHLFCVDGPAYGRVDRIGLRCRPLHVGPPQSGTAKRHPAPVARKRRADEDDDRPRSQARRRPGWFHRHSDRKSSENYLEHVGG